MTVTGGKALPAATDVGSDAAGSGSADFVPVSERLVAAPFAAASERAVSNSLQVGRGVVTLGVGAAGGAVSGAFDGGAGTDTAARGTFGSGVTTPDAGLSVMSTGEAAG